MAFDRFMAGKGKGASGTGIADRVRKEFNQTHPYYGHHLNIAEQFDQFYANSQKVAADISKVPATQYTSKEGVEYTEKVIQQKHTNIYESMLENIAKRHKIKYSRGMGSVEKAKALDELRVHLPRYNLRSEKDLKEMVESEVAIGDEKTPDDIKALATRLGQTYTNAQLQQSMTPLNNEDYAKHAKKGGAHHKLISMMHEANGYKRPIKEKLEFQNWAQSANRAAQRSYQLAEQYRHPE